jgi:hypothetical protein
LDIQKKKLAALDVFASLFKIIKIIRGMNWTQFEEEVFN